MDEEKWSQLVENIRSKFEIVEENEEPDIITDDVGGEIKGTKKTVVFNSERGQMMLVRTERPMIIDKKTHYHRAKGGGGKVEYVASDEEMTTKVNLYIWDESQGDWKEIDTKGSFTF